MTGFDTRSFGQEPVEVRKTSGLAIASLVCSLICCIPLTTIAGVLLGIGAMVSIGRDPLKKGKGLAMAGIVLGAVFTAVFSVGWLVGAPKVYALVKESMLVVERGPRDALAAGFAGDTAGFKAAFHGEGATASDAVAQSFIEGLRVRYGEFVGSQIHQQQNQQTFGTPVVPFSYTIEFSPKKLNAETQIVFSDPKTGGFIMKIGYITIFDEELGDMTYPPRTGS